MVQIFPYSSLVTALAVLVYVLASFKVGSARGKFNVAAPAIDGPPEFQRIFRVHMNTLEQLVFFIPALWLFATAWGDMLAAIIGIFWPIGRILYARGYIAAPEKRAMGFGISFLPSAILLLGGLVGIVRRLVFA
jgi:glutathione S-transferase